MRKRYSNLPSEVELGETLATEGQRPIPELKTSQHFASLEPVQIFLEKIDAPKIEFSLDLSWQEVLTRGQEYLVQVLPFILKQDPNKIAQPAAELYQYLAEEDQPLKADFIIAFGAKTVARAEKAVELYGQGLAPKIIFTGKSPIYAAGKPEALIYQEIALEKGVPKEDIMVETNSITLPDNVRSTLNLLDSLRLKYQRLILVNSPYAQRRGYGYMQKYTPENIEICRVNCSTREGLRVDDWFKNEEGIKYVLQEFAKIWISLVTNTI